MTTRFPFSSLRLGVTKHSRNVSGAVIIIEIQILHQQIAKLKQKARVRRAVRRQTDLPAEFVQWQDRCALAIDVRIARHALCELGIEADERAVRLVALQQRQHVTHAIKIVDSVAVAGDEFISVLELRLDASAIGGGEREADEEGAERRELRIRRGENFFGVLLTTMSIRKLNDRQIPVEIERPAHTGFRADARCRC